MTAMDKNEMAQANPFKDLNLIALRQHACPKASKNNEWYLSCIDCPDNCTCGVGRRVNEILEKTTKPEKSQIEKFAERMEKKEKLDVEARFREAVRHDDPFKWLVEQGYYVSRHTAYNNYIKFREKHPEMPSTKDLTRASKANGCKENGRKRIVTVRLAIQRLFADCPKDKMLERYLERGIGRDRSIVSAYTKLRDWCNKYPDLEQEIGYGSIRPILRGMWCDYNGKTVGEVLDIMQTERNYDDEDVVSLTDFLMENERPAEEPKKPEKPDTEDDPDDEPEEAAKFRFMSAGDIANDKSVQQWTLQFIFSKKRQELKARIGREEQNLRDLQAEIERLKGQIRTLDETALMFGLAATDDSGKEVSA